MKPSSSSSPRRVAVSKDRIISDLRKIGVREGDHIAVTLSFRSIGHVDGGPTTFIDALLEAVGPNGTIMMNTYTRTFPLSAIASDYISDYRSTPTWTGLVPETLRKRRDSIRSHHPSASVTAIGRLAKYLTEGHDENSSLFMPYSRLADVGGKYLCIGLGNNLVAIRHEAQHLAGLSDVVDRWRGVKYRDDEGKVKIYAFNSPPCIRKSPELVPTMRKMGIVKIGKVGMARSIIASAKDLLHAMAQMLEKTPTLNLCDKVWCLWCREAERRLVLYEKIENSRFFQRNVFMKRTIALINEFRLNEYSFLSFRSGKGNWSASGVLVSRILGIFWGGYLTFRRIFMRARIKQDIHARNWTIPLACACREKPSNM